MKKNTVWEINDPLEGRAVAQTSVTEDQPVQKPQSKLEKKPLQKGSTSKTIPTEGRPTLKVRARVQKNPALAFALSMLVWGGGQIYNRQWKLGSLFFLFMVNFWTDLLILMMFWSNGLSSFITNHIGTFAVMTACGVFYLSGVLFWFSNAIHAYYTARCTRTDRFNGVKLAFLPPLLSLLIPGWGQFLNGQVKKGVFFLLITVVGLSAIPYCWLFPMLWSAAKTAGQHRFLEWGLVIALLVTPVVFMTWLFGIFDALKVAINDIKKEPLRKRIGYAVNRVRMHGLMHGLMPQAKLTALLGLVFVCVLLFSYFLFPRTFYAKRLQRMQARMSQQEMVVIPSLANRILEESPPPESHQPVHPKSTRLNI